MGRPRRRSASHGGHAAATIRGTSFPLECAIDNTELYILDADLNPVPPGTAGELYIAGLCVGRGYLNQPDLTADRFIPIPFNAAGEARMYRTGDLCWFLEDGVIDFLGRMDDQVKVRGVRIELGEVEKAVAAHEAVEACVAAEEQRDGETILALYVIPRLDGCRRIADCGAFCGGSCRNRVIPSEFLFVDAFPLSANGKIDRKRLALPRLAQAAAPQPRDGIERRVSAAWQRVLKHAQFSVHDDFFDFGGDFLSATELLIRLETEFGIRIPLDEALDTFTIEAIAGLLRDASNAGESEAAPPTIVQVEWGPARRRRRSRSSPRGARRRVPIAGSPRWTT